MKRVRWCVAMAALLGGAAWACDVPVFRYALERWEADPYEVVVFHRGPLDDAAQACVDQLEDARMTGANLVVRPVDLDGSPSPVDFALWDAQADAALPWALLHYPHPARGQGPAWAGALTPENCARIAASPARRTLAEHLIDGEGGVFVLLASGDAARDQAAEATLEAGLAKAEEHLELPTGTTAAAPQMDEAMLDEMDVRFSMVRLDRSDPAEAVFTAMLLGTEPDLAELDGPMVFPVFGRARALYALVDRGITEKTVTEACSFIVGSCTCQVKDLNPGTDLLVAANWDDELDMLLSVETLVNVLPSPADMVAATVQETPETPAETPPPTEHGPAVQAPTPPAPAEAPAKAMGIGLFSGVAVVVAAGLVLVVAATLVLVLRGRGGA